MERGQARAYHIAPDIGAGLPTLGWNPRRYVGATSRSPLPPRYLQREKGL